MLAPIALQLYSLRESAQEDFEKTIHKVAQMGYAGVEPANFPGTTPERAGQLFKELGLAVPSAHLPLPVGDQKNEVLDAMQAIGSQRVISGKGPADFETVDKIKATCEIFNTAAENARSAGLAFGLHNHCWEYLKVGERYAYQYLLDWLDPEIFFEIDTYWVQTAGVDPALVIKELGSRVPILHIKDGPCVKSEPMTAVGDGKLDFHSIIAAGEAHTEWLIVELDRCATDMEEAVHKSLRYLVNEGLGRGMQV
ncbi:MAG: sugar phosphate isomerase/epimerase [Anaerolineae bacterium]|nr:sugar phosphate isomerase/epimerase [Anaerolineae bacterium]